MHFILGLGWDTLYIYILIYDILRIFRLKLKDEYLILRKVLIEFPNIGKLNSGKEKSYKKPKLWD
jgi:hypothetical protein